MDKRQAVSWSTLHAWLFIISLELNWSFIFHQLQMQGGTGQENPFIDPKFTPVPHVCNHPFWKGKRKHHATIVTDKRKMPPFFHFSYISHQNWPPIICQHWKKIHRRKKTQKGPSKNHCIIEMKKFWSFSPKTAHPDFSNANLSKKIKDQVDSPPPLTQTLCLSPPSSVIQVTEKQRKGKGLYDTETKWYLLIWQCQKVYFILFLISDPSTHSHTQYLYLSGICGRERDRKKKHIKINNHYNKK